MATIILDAGHGGWHNGAVYEGRLEKDDTLALTLAVGRILEDNGINVLYTRTNDSYRSPMERADTANETNADYFVSIHRNASPTAGQYSGVETLVYNKSGEAGRLAEAINRNLEGVGFINQGVRENTNLVVLNRTRMPAVLVEAGFIDNPADNKIFDQSFSAVAQGIAQGILTTLREMERPVYYQVQVAAYQDRQAAQQLEDTLTGQGFPAFLVYEDGLYKVRVGAFLNLDNAVHMEQTIRSYGYPTVMVRG